MYENIEKMAEKADIQMTIPCSCVSRQFETTLMPRHQLPIFDAHCFFPFLTTLLQQIKTRFNELSEAALLGLLLIPANLQKLQKSSQEKVIQHYSPDIPSPSSASLELELWKHF